jgi:hypothetical protein
MALVERYPHTISKKNRNWDNCEYLQFLAIDPGIVNFCFRIEKRYKDGRIVPVAFWKAAFRNDRYSAILRKLDEFKKYYLETHVVIIEKQPPRSIAINRVMQHTLSYFMVRMQDYPLLPEIIEIDARVKGNTLGASPDENLKRWASKKARELLKVRNDSWSLEVMDYWKKPGRPKGERKDDDLADTIVMIEAYCSRKNLPLTGHRAKRKFKVASKV